MDKLDDMITVAFDGLGGPADLKDVLVELATRLKATEAALDRLWPGWQMGTLTCLPNCNGACCND